MADRRDSGVAMYDIRGDKSEQSLLEMIKQGLTSEPKTMPTLLLYDEKGLKLFEDITYLDEYYLTNAEIDVLTRHADAVVEHVPAGARIVELGSGNMRKVNILLEALERAQKRVDYFALDLSYPELKRTFSELDTSRFQFVNFNAFHGTYDDGLAWLSKAEHKDKPNVVLSLGSSIGNFARPEAGQFLHGFSQALSAQDLVIIGLDATSDQERIFSAYNDSKGVTESFYRNGLDHANAIIGHEAFKQGEWAVKGEYVKEANKHQASYVALKDVTIENVNIKKGEALPFEHAHKFVDEESDHLWHEAGLVSKAVYLDSTGNHRLHILRPSAVRFETAPDSYAEFTVPSTNDWQQLWSAWDTVTRSMVPRDELMNKPIKLRNNLIFYLGHIPTFADIHFTKATGAQPTDPKYYSQIFERGIDPDVDDPTQCHAHSDIPDEWPALQEILDYQLKVRNRVIQSIQSGKASSNRKLARGLTLAYEHEGMHLETFLYMLLQSDRVLPPPGRPIPDFEALANASRVERSKNEWHTIPSSKVVIGGDDPENNEGPDRYYLWDNERPSRVVKIDQFEAQSRPISNGEYAKFLEATHQRQLPASWTGKIEEVNGTTTNGTNGTFSSSANGTDQIASDYFLEGKAIRTVYGPVPLKFALDWPVMASYDELAAFARWAGGHIPNLEELKSIYQYVQTQELQAQKTHSSLVPAVNGHLSNDGVEETPPSSGSFPKAGSAASPHPNPTDLFIDLEGRNVGFKHWHPTPITAEGSRLRGQSDVGGLWEWTSSPFTAHDGFESMKLYPGYSADFFDDKHNVCLGGSWATVPRIAGRKSFVNWYQRNYPFVWCTARLVRDVA
ncbi:hypothetical protein OHC33_003302 [Knufia fluminis]|uniref:Uncharacterized protein n=1 Tax=Knufia fluminis TaxID=191047 RepID=A0AAN8FCC5_9EURO|nr:hypothetical protein OHC33_003302 [Knufia fluminis]